MSDYALAAGAGLLQPRIEGRDGDRFGGHDAAAAADDLAEPAAEIDDLGRLAILPDASDLRGSLGIEIVRFTQEMP